MQEELLLAVMAKDQASAIFSRVGVAIDDMAKKFGAAKSNADGVSESFVKSHAGILGVGIAGAAAAVGVGLLAEHAVKLAANFEAATTTLVTGAGEDAKALDSVRKGVLAIGDQTGTTWQQLNDGLYMIESAGFHGASGLQVLKAAAEGAKVGGADLGVVGNALTTVLTGYSLKASEAANVTSQMVATVAAGKMHMQDLAGSMAVILPSAANAKISFAEVGGAIATMTAQGTSAQEASQQLNSVIRAFMNPSHEAVNMMEQLGLSSVDLVTHLGERGLTGTFDKLSQAVAAKMGPSGLVYLDIMKKSKSASEDAHIMLAKLPTSVQALGEKFLAGTITMKEWRHAMMGTDVATKQMMTQFAGAAQASRGFNDTLKAHKPEAETFQAMMSKMLGGASGLQVALELGGEHMATWRQNVKDIGAASSEAGGHVRGWAAVQSDFNTKQDQFRATMEHVMITLGTALLPVMKKLMDAILPVVTKFADWADHNQNLLAAILAVTGALGAMLAVGAAIGLFLGVIGGMGAAVGGVIALGSAFMVMAGEEGILAAANIALGLAEDSALLPILLVVAAIALLVAGVIWAYNNFKPFHDIVNQVGAAVGRFAGWVGSSAVPAVAKFVGEIGKAVGQLPAIWSAITTGVSHFVGEVGKAITGIVKFFEELPGKVASALGNFIAAVGRFFELLPGRMIYALGYATGTLVKWGVELVHWAEKAIPEFINNVIKFLHDLPGKIWDVAGEAHQKIVAFGVGIVLWAEKAIPEFIANVVNFLKAMPGKAWDVLVLLYTKFADFEMSIIHWAEKAIPEFIGKVVTFLQSLPGRVKGVWDTVTTTLKGWAATAHDWIAQEIPSLVNGIVKFFEELPGKMLKIGRDIIGGIVKGISDGGKSITGPIGDAVNGFLKGFQDASQIHSPSILMAKEVGEPLIEGVAAGITRRKDVVTTALSMSLSSRPAAPIVNVSAPAALRDEEGLGIQREIVQLLQMLVEAVTATPATPTGTAATLIQALTAASYMRNRGFAGAPVGQ